MVNKKHSWCFFFQFGWASNYYRFLLDIHKCFTGKYTTCKIHTKPHPRLKWLIFYIFTSEDLMKSLTMISCSTIKLNLNSLLYDTNIYLKHQKFLESLRDSLVIFSNLRKFLENVWKCFFVAFIQFCENLLKCRSEIFGKSSKMSLSVCFYNKQNNHMISE